MKKETRCRHIGCSFRLAVRVLLYAPSHRQDSTYHSLCYTSCGALAGTRNSSMGSPHEGSIQRPIAPWVNGPTTELHLAPSTLDEGHILLLASFTKARLLFWWSFMVWISSSMQLVMWMVPRYHCRLCFVCQTFLLLFKKIIIIIILA